MRRREALRASLTALAVGVTGCSSALARREETPNTGTGAQSVSSRTVSLQGVEELPDSISAAITVELLSDTITSDHTATIRTTLRNTGSREREFDIACQSVLPYPLYSESGAYVFLPAFQEYARKTGCWENENPDEDPYRALECEGTARLQPDESRSAELALWSGTDDTKCMPVGDVRFSTELLEGNHRWGFTVEMEK